MSEMTTDEAREALLARAAEAHVTGWVTQGIELGKREAEAAIRAEWAALREANERMARALRGVYVVTPRGTKVDALLDSVREDVRAALDATEGER